MAELASDIQTITPDDKMGLHSNRLITVEPVLFLLFFVQAGMITLRTQYTEYRLAEIHNYTLPGVNSSGCANVSVPNPTRQAQIESETAVWTMYMESMSTFPPIATALILATVSDFVGRRPMFIIGALGHVIASVTFFLTVFFKLPLVVLVAGQAVLGLCGDTALLTAVGFSYIADVTTERAQKNRSFRFVINDLMTHLGMGAAFLSINFALQQTNNYPLVYGINAIPAILALLYVTPPCILRESVKKLPLRRRIFKDLVLSIYRLFKHNINRRRWKLLVLLMCQFLYDVVYEDLFGVVVIYGLGTPFCWSHDVVGMYGVICAASPAIGSVFAMKIFSDCMSEFTLVCMGFVSGIGLILSSAIATTNIFLLYVAPGLGLLRTLPMSILKSLMSKTVDKDEQGALFGSVSVVVSVARSISPFLLKGVYSATVKIDHPTITFFMTICLLVIAILLVLFAESMPHWQPRPGYMALQGTDRAVRRPVSANHF